MAILSGLIQLYTLLIFIRIMLTWVPNLDPDLPLVRLLMQITDPVLDFARRYIPPLGMIDISPMVVMIVLMFLLRILNSV